MNPPQSDRPQGAPGLDGETLEQLVERITSQVVSRLERSGTRPSVSPPTTPGSPIDSPTRPRISRIASVIDHTLLRSDATPAEIERLCHEAVSHGFHSVCVNSCHAVGAACALGNSPVRLCVTVGFPLGAATTEAKVSETRQAVTDGAHEIDMVMAVGMLRGGRHTYVAHDIRSVVQSAADLPVKVILETALLSEDEKRTACQIARESGAAFVKTSTGFSSAGATIDDVRLMAQEVAPELGVKASGGIRSHATATALLKAGATRLGTSNGVAIIEEERAQAGPGC